MCHASLWRSIPSLNAPLHAISRHTQLPTPLMHSPFHVILRLLKELPPHVVLWVQAPKGWCLLGRGDLRRGCGSGGWDGLLSGGAIWGGWWGRVGGGNVEQHGHYILKAALQMREGVTVLFMNNGGYATRISLQAVETHTQMHQISCILINADESDFIFSYAYTQMHHISYTQMHQISYILMNADASDFIYSMCIRRCIKFHTFWWMLCQHMYLVHQKNSTQFNFVMMS